MEQEEELLFKIYHISGYTKDDTEEQENRPS